MLFLARLHVTLSSLRVGASALCLATGRYGSIVDCGRRGEVTMAAGSWLAEHLGGGAEAVEKNCSKASRLYWAKIAETGRTILDRGDAQAACGAA